MVNDRTLKLITLFLCILLIVAYIAYHVGYCRGMSDADLLYKALKSDKQQTFVLPEIETQRGE